MVVDLISLLISISESKPYTPIACTNTHKSIDRLQMFGVGHQGRQMHRLCRQGAVYSMLCVLTIFKKAYCDKMLGMQINIFAQTCSASWAYMEIRACLQATSCATGKYLQRCPVRYTPTICASSRLPRLTQSLSTRDSHLARWNKYQGRSHIHKVTHTTHMHEHSKLSHLFIHSLNYNRRIVFVI